MMAFAASLVNLSMGLVGDLTGAFINKTFVGVTEDDLSKFYILYYISIVSVFYELCLIWLIPLRKDVEKEFKH